MHTSIVRLDLAGHASTAGLGFAARTSRLGVAPRASESIVTPDFEVRASIVYVGGGGEKSGAGLCW